MDGNGRADDDEGQANYCKWIGEGGRKRGCGCTIVRMEEGGGTEGEGTWPNWKIRKKGAKKTWREDEKKEAKVLEEWE